MRKLAVGGLLCLLLAPAGLEAGVLRVRSDRSNGPGNRPSYYLLPARQHAGLPQNPVQRALKIESIRAWGPRPYTDPPILQPGVYYLYTACPTRVRLNDFLQISGNEEEPITLLCR